MTSKSNLFIKNRSLIKIVSSTENPEEKITIFYLEISLKHVLSDTQPSLNLEIEISIWGLFNREANSKQLCSWTFFTKPSKKYLKIDFLG